MLYNKTNIEDKKSKTDKRSLGTSKNACLIRKIQRIGKTLRENTKTSDNPAKFQSSGLEPKTYQNPIRERPF